RPKVFPALPHASGGEGSATSAAPILARATPPHPALCAAGACAGRGSGPWFDLLPSTGGSLCERRCKHAGKRSRSGARGEAGEMPEHREDVQMEPRGDPAPDAVARIEHEKDRDAAHDDEIPAAVIRQQLAQ